MEITTLEQAELTLYKHNAIQTIYNQPMVEGKQLLDICGFSYIEPNGKSQAKKVLVRQIERHSFYEGTDYRATINGRSTTYHFTVNAANHVLLAAMTTEGQVARQEAIDTKVTVVDNRFNDFADKLERMQEKYIESLQRMIPDIVKATIESIPPRIQEVEVHTRVEPALREVFPISHWAKQIDIKAVVANERLRAQGFIVRDAAHWRLTELGRSVGGENTNPSRYKLEKIEWHNSVLSYLSE